MADTMASEVRPARGMSISDGVNPIEIPRYRLAGKDRVLSSADGLPIIPAPGMMRDIVVPTMQSALPSRHMLIPTMFISPILSRLENPSERMSLRLTETPNGNCLWSIRAVPVPVSIVYRSVPSITA